MKKMFAAFLLTGLIFPLASLGQVGQRMLLTFKSEGSMQVFGIYGPAGVTVKTEGYAYLIPGAQGKFSGTGEIYVTMDFNYPKTGTVSISQLKGQGPLNVVGETEGKNLKFYFKHQEIVCKGEIVVSAPAPVGTFKEPYEDSFDPHVLAPGQEPGAKIELKDGATSTFRYGPQSFAGGKQNVTWKTDFTLDGVELWRVAITGQEIDNNEQAIKNKKLQTKNKELPVAMKFEWKLIGEFSIIGKGGARQYYDGQVFSAIINPIIVFEFQDLYRWDELPCKETWDAEDLNGQTIGGKVSGSTVQLKWPEIHPKECYSLFPLKSYLGQLRPHKEFESMEFLGYISREKLPLVDGQVVTGSQSDWLSYKITLTKLK